MKKWFLVLMAVLFLAGCGAAARQSQLPEHNAMYQSWDHMMFSWFGYKNQTPQDVQKSKEQGWWGIPADQAK
jgi:uncharacterized protein YcfL